MDRTMQKNGWTYRQYSGPGLVHEDAAQTARKIRKALKAAHPGTKFSVRTSKYSMGSSVRVSWTDGPTSEEVRPLLQSFQSASFDAMTDSQTVHGYEFDGMRVSGAKYIYGQRETTGAEVTA